MEEKNDTQEVQPETNEQEQEVEQEVNTEMEALKAQLAEKDEQIANLSRAKRELKKATKETNTNKPQSDSLDYAEKAYLRTNGIEAIEFDFIQQQMEESGIRDIDKLLNNGYFKSQLEETRTKRVVAQATPDGTRVTSESPKSKPEYWINRGEMPADTPENRSLRREVVNARYNKEKKSSQFTSQSLVS
jgi:hypothetical protein